MIRITKRAEAAPSKYSVATVAFALGVTEGAVRGTFRDQEFSLKDGLTIDQVEMVINRRTRGDGVCWKSVEDLRAKLSMRGYEISEVPYEEEEGLPL